MTRPANDLRCPVCSGIATVPIVRRNGVPVHQNMLYPTADEALSARRGDLDMRMCERCGFVFNAAFDPDLLEYGPGYENSQQHSDAFADHLDLMADRIVGHHAAVEGTVVEVGCGKGDFLVRLLRRPGCRAQGFGIDPSYLGPETALEGRARFVTAFFDERIDLQPDVVVCRHVIEHVADPLHLLRAVRSASVEGRTRVFFETPCVEWILRNSVLWDLFYEHCSLFTAHSLGVAMTRSGFRVTEVRHVFGGQYLWAEAEVANGAWPDTPEEVPQEAAQIAELEQARVSEWTDLLKRHRRRGPVVLWGAGAKGLTFCNLVDPDRSLLDRVVDVNPAKQGRFLGGSGHPIVDPTAARGAATAVVLNPNYVAEIRKLLSTIDPDTRVVDWMEL